MLMQDIEALYKSAVSAQESLHKRKAHLAAQKEAAQAAVNQFKEQVALLDKQIGDVKEQRSCLENSLRNCTAALNEACANVASQVGWEMQCCVVLCYWMDRWCVLYVNMQHLHILVIIYNRIVKFFNGCD